MKIKKKIPIFGIFVVIAFGIAVGSIMLASSGNNFAAENFELNEVNSNVDSLDSSIANFDALLESLNSKITEYSSLGYFDQLYQPSLQATYYGLSILQAIGKLDTIDANSIVDYITSIYNASSHVFIDDYAFRYLKSDFSKEYYPLTTVLEVNCYAILSLDVLNQLNLIDVQASIDFIWSCYNPITSGFVGQPYSSSLNDFFKTSTLDNTYFAIKTLDHLTDWSLYPTQKNDLKNFINGLQSINTNPGELGGFLNDYNSEFLSLGPLDPTILSCYYAVKSLEVFNLIETINMESFRQYLSNLYDTTKKFFKINYYTNNDTNLAATAIGLELSQLISYTGCNQSGVVNFLLTHRNSYGTWDCSTNNKNRELIDTYEILRSLQDVGEISKLSANDKTQIASAMLGYNRFKAFSLFSKDILTLNLIYTITNAFSLCNRISDLPINYLYNRVLNSTCYSTLMNYLSFFPCSNLGTNSGLGFRSKPIEFGSDSYNARSHKTTFYAIDSLDKLSKLELNDFGLKYDLYAIVNSIINSQFLELEYDNYGAFLPTLYYQYPALDSEFRNKAIKFEDSYYAIKALEPLAKSLNLGKVKDLGINLNALYTYMNRRVVITSDQIYFNDNLDNTIEDRIQKTYFMMYLLKTLELPSFDNQNIKIKSFLERNLNYSNVKNLYYSWKLSELLDLDFSFNKSRSHDLVKNAFDQNLAEFYLTLNKEKISQETFLWICEMAKKDEIQINCSYVDYILLGSKINIMVSLNNVILDVFKPPITVTDITIKYKSEKIGEIVLNKISNENAYSCELIIPNSLYQSIEGNISVYDGSTKIAEKQIVIHVSGSPSPSSSSSAASEENSINAKDSKQNNEEKIEIAIPLVIMLMAFPAATIAISYKMKRDSLIE